MRDSLGMDPIPDGEREKMFVELITRETLRVQADLDVEVAKASPTGTGETNNKSKNGGGAKKKSSSSSSSKSKASISPQTIGLAKDYVDNMEDSIDNYIRDCFRSNTQVIQRELLTRVQACNKGIAHALAKEDVGDDLKTAIAKESARLVNYIHNDLVGTNTYASKELAILDIIDVRVAYYKDSLIKYLSAYSKPDENPKEGGP